MKEAKKQYYNTEILKCLIDGDVVSTQQIADAVGMSEKSIRNKIFDINEYCYEGYIPFEVLSVSYDADLMEADETQAFPADYQSALNALHQAHPNWVFKPVMLAILFHMQ